MRETAVILNPIAGGGRALSGWERMARHHRGSGTELFTSEFPGHAEQLSSLAVREGFARIISIGGDGTLHEVVNGMLQQGMNGSEEYSGPHLGVIPLGRGNDFARTLGIPRREHPFWRAQLEGNAPTVRGLDVGRVQTGTNASSSYFINMCGAGFDADAVAVANRLPPRLGGALPYLIGIMQSLVRLTHRKLRVHLEGVVPVSGQRIDHWESLLDHGDGTMTVEDDLLLATVGIGKYQGGGFMLLPLADPTDGHVDVLLARNLSRVRFLKVLMRTFRGEHLQEDEVLYLRARRVTIEGPDHTNIQADGEALGRRQATIDVIPQVLPVMF